MRPYRTALVAALLTGSAIAAPSAPHGLLLNLLRHPETTVITDARPRFSWIVNDPTRGAVQSAYEIRLGTGDKEVWTSGQVKSDDSVSVPYRGQPLTSNQSYWWQVRTWDARGNASPWSVRQNFRTADLSLHRTPGERRWVNVEGQWAIENQEAMQHVPIPPTTLKKTADGTYFIDFGRAAFATIRLTITSPDDRTIKIDLGEKRTANAVDPKPGGSIYHGAYSLPVTNGTYTYDLALPRHVSKMPHSLIFPDGIPEVEPFRYAELSNVPGDLKPDDVRQVAMFYPFDDSASSFTCPSTDLIAVWDISKYTMKAASFAGTYTDGVRERMPYEADCLVQMLGHHAVDREYAIGRGSAEFLDYNATWPTEWILDSVLMAYEDWMATADPTSITQNWDTLKAKLLLPLAREDGLISTKTGKQTPALMESLHYNGKSLKDITDWPQPSETDNFAFADYNAVINALHYRALVQMADMATPAGHPDDAAPLRARAEKVMASFNKAFFNPSTGLYVDGEGVTHSSVHANASALAFNLVPPDRVPPIAAFLKSRSGTR